MNLENKKQEEELEDSSETDELREEIETPISDLAVFNLMKAVAENSRQERLKKK